MQQDEAKLIRRAQLGEDDALMALYRQHQAAVYTYILTHVSGNQAVAEDLTSEVFVRMVARIHGWRGMGRPLQAWLITIARNLVADHYRIEGRTPWLALHDTQAGDAPAPESVSSANWERRRLYQALAQLTPDQRDVLVMRFFNEMSVAETAVTLHKQAGAVKTLTRRALAALRRHLEKADE